MCCCLRVPHKTRSNNRSSFQEAPEDSKFFFYHILASTEDSFPSFSLLYGYSPHLYFTVSTVLGQPAQTCTSSWKEFNFRHTEFNLPCCTLHYIVHFVFIKHLKVQWVRYGHNCCWKHSKNKLMLSQHNVKKQMCWRYCRGIYWS